MKTRITTLAVLLTALGGFVVSPLAAATSDQTQARMHSVKRVFPSGHSESIAVGSSLNLVCHLLGSADEQLTRNLWLYQNFCANEVDSRGDLVIEFTNERVSSIHLVNPRARKVFIARAKSGIVDSAGVLAAVMEPTTGTQVAGK